MNRKLQTVIVTAAVAVLVHVNCSAQTHDKGSIKLSLGGSLSSHETFVEGVSSGRTTTDVQFMGELGYFFADSWELAAALSANSSWVSDSASDYGRVRGEVLLKRYFISESNLVPYVGVKGGFTAVTTGNYSYTDPHVGGKLGVEWLLNEDTSAFAEYDLSAQFHSRGGVSSTTVTNQANIGLTFYF